MAITESTAPLRLEPLSRDHLSGLLETAEEFRIAGEHEFDDVLEDPKAFFAEVDRYSRGEGLPPDRVPMNWFLLFAGERVLGCGRLRHWLIPALELDGGHIGYAIRPSERRRGVATALPSLLLDRARQIGLDRVLLTAADTNTASRRVIEINGGVSDGTRISPNTGEAMCLYWISL